MIQNAPTDNLYKFVTFLGIALVMFCVWTITELDRKQAESLIIADRELLAKDSSGVFDITKMTLEHQYLAALMKKYDSTENPIEKQLIASQMQSSRQYINTLRAQFEKYLTELREKNDTALLPALRAAAAPNSQRLVLYAGAVSGALMTLFGFLSWYIFHQRFQDEILRRQASSSNSVPVSPNP